METPVIYLKSKKDRPLRRFHPWVFSGAIKKIDGDPQSGDLVRVCSNKGGFLGLGHFSEGTIAVRIITFDDVVPKTSFWIEKLKAAYELRKSIGMVKDKHTNIYRLVHAEGDGFPGLIIDIYNKTAVVQAHSAGMHAIRHQIKDGLIDIYGKKLKTIYYKSEKTLAKCGVTAEDEFLFGEENESNIALEYDCKFNINWITGQKTGFFIDQRENRELLGHYAKGKTILNTFCYSGGFSINALMKGAKEVHSLDSSEKALKLVEENIELNDLQDANHKTIKADAVEYLKDVGNEFDIIVLDPPAFAKHQSARHQAIQGYKRLNANAIRQIKPGGLIFTFSCSQAIDKSMFTSTILAAAIAVGRKVRILHQLHQPADHPINIFHPESEYLKGLVIEVE